MIILMQKIGFLQECNHVDFVEELGRESKMRFAKRHSLNSRGFEPGC